MKILRTIGILALVAGLVLGGVGSALAEKPTDVPRGGGPHSPKHGLSGNVTAVAPSTVTEITAAEEFVIHLETMDWGTVVVTANVTTKYMVPRETRGSANLTRFLEIVDKNDDGNLLEELLGRRLALLVTFAADNTTADAIKLMLVPSPHSPPLHAHRVGVVQVFDPDPPDPSITIIGKDGEPHTFTISEDTVYRPDDIDMNAIIGGYVTVVTKGDAGAKAIVLHID